MLSCVRPGVLTRSPEPRGDWTGAVNRTVQTRHPQLLAYPQVFRGDQDLLARHQNSAKQPHRRGQDSASTHVIAPTAA